MSSAWIPGHCGLIIHVGDDQLVHVPLFVLTSTLLMRALHDRGHVGAEGLFLRGSWKSYSNPMKDFNHEDLALHPEASSCTHLTLKQSLLKPCMFAAFPFSSWVLKTLDAALRGIRVDGGLHTHRDFLPQRVQP